MLTPQVCKLLETQAASLAQLSADLREAALATEAFAPPPSKPLDIDGNAPKSSQISSIDQYWGIDESYAQGILVKLDGISVVEASRLQAEFDQKNADQSKAPYQLINGTAIIPISGPMTKRATSAQFLTGGCSTKAIIGLLNKAESDKSVKNVLLHIESPGGQVSGNAELADKIRTFSKPTVAFIEDMGASCAYWVASQCDHIMANAMAEVGSIGVYGVVSDSSERANMMGVKVHLIKSGSHKGAGTPGTEVTAEHLADMQARVDELFGVFKDAVMAGRGLEANQLDPIADGRSFGAAKALEYGLIDGICSFEECVESISGGKPAVSSYGGNTPDPARASDPRGQGNQMNLKEILARLKKVDKSALEAQGIDPDALDTFVPDGSHDSERIQAEMARMKKAALFASADNFYNSLRSPDSNGGIRALGSQREGIISTFMTLATMDGTAFGERNELIPGASLKGYMDTLSKAAPTYLETSQIKDGDPNGNATVRTAVMTKAVKRLAANGRITQEAAKGAVEILGGAN